MGYEQTGFDPAKLAGFLDEYGLSYRTKQNSFVMTCPLCSKSEKLYIRRSDGRFICWYCAEDKGFRGAPEFALRELTGASLADIRAILYGYADIKVGAARYLDLDFGDVPEDDEEIMELPPEIPTLEAPYHCYPLDHEWSAKGVEYLANRGVPLEVAQKYGITYSPKERAVMLPIEIGDRLVGWQFRSIDTEKVVLEDGTVSKRLRIWSNSELSGYRDRVVMFSNRLTSDYAVLCEGPFDAIKADLVGGNIATMGTALGDQQISVLRNAGIKRLFIAIDPDKVSAVESIASRFPDIEIHWVEIPKPYEDLGEMSMEDARHCILSSPVFDPGRIIPVYFPPIAGEPKAW